MRQRGIAVWKIVAGVALVAILVVAFAMASGSPATAASRWMAALYSGDTATLAEVSYFDGVEKDQVKAKWDQSFEFARHYRFRYEQLRASTTGAETATVVYYVWRNADTMATYEERFEIPMIKVDGQWKVDVRGVSRDMFPFLPR